MLGHSPYGALDADHGHKVRPFAQTAEHAMKQQRETKTPQLKLKALLSKL